MEKRRKAKKRFSALTSFLLALALLASTLGALPAECFAAQPEKAAFHSTYGFRLGSSAKMELQFRDKLEKITRSTATPTTAAKPIWAANCGTRWRGATTRWCCAWPPIGGG